MRAALLALLLIFTPATATLADNDVGCGVGTMIFEGKSGLPFKLLASCINGMTFQSISITFGIVNCDGRGTVTADASDARLKHFAKTNIDRLARDMATGQGESLDALANLLGVADADRAHFAEVTRSEYETLFSSDSIRSTELLENLDRVLAKDATLSVYARS